MKTWIAQEHTRETQKRVPFTGEGAYHGSTKPKPRPQQLIPAVVVPEARPTTLERYLEEGRTTIDTFDARFPNWYAVREYLSMPTQEEIRNDGVTFCWCPFKEAMQEAGPLTRTVLTAMQRHVSGRKRHVYIDSKIQYFEVGDLPVDSQLWHVDGSIAVRDQRVQQLGASTLHDMRARCEGNNSPLYLAYQSSMHCATHFLDQPLSLHLPELIPNFGGLDAAVRAARPVAVLQPAGSIVAFDGLSLHRAVPASASGWRLWVRCIETDIEIRLEDETIIECYGTIFRTTAP